MKPPVRVDLSKATLRYSPEYYEDGSVEGGWIVMTFDEYYYNEEDLWEFLDIWDVIGD